MTGRLLAVAAALQLVSGCGFYFGDDDDCEFGGAPSPDEPSVGYRDPVSGQCQFFGGGVVGDPCDPRPLEGADRAPAAEPDWGLCVSQCTGLDESSCLEAPACRAVYQLPENDTDTANAAYADCWATAQSGAIQGGGCAGLDAYQCSRHDDCVAYHVTEFGCDAPEGADCAPMPRLGSYFSCGPEPDSNPPPPACAELSEEACVERADCSAFYVGIDCTCQGDQCTCAEWIFDECAAG